MSKRRSQPEIPVPVIDGFLEVGVGGLYAGMNPTDRLREIYGIIEDQEVRIIRNQNRRRLPDLERINAAQYHLGQIAAVNALIDLPPPREVGFSSVS